MNTIKKLSLFLRISDPGSIVYTVSPDPKKEIHEHDYKILDFDIDVSTRTTVQINLLNKLSNQDYIQIFKVLLNDIELHDFNFYSVYKTTDGKIKKTNGWLDEPGSCKINIHTNPISQSILTYLLIPK